MKKIIRGKKYDTETAKLVVDGDDGEKLYLKHTGEFFIHGDGYESPFCALPDYFRYCFDDQYILPLTLDDAKEWTELYGSGDDYERLFGAVEE